MSVSQPVMSLVGPPLLVAFGASLVYLIPSHTIAVLTAWVLLSFPTGMLLGHCALSEAEDAQSIR